MNTLPDPTCPSDEELAAYLDERLEPDRQARLAAHAVECDDCRAIMVDAADALATYPKRKRLRFAAGGLVAAAAAAAVLLVAVPRVDELPTTRDPVVRAPVTEDVPRITALEPGSGASVPREGIVFGWEAQVSGTVYRLTVSDARGAVVWSERTEESSLAMPAAVAQSLLTGQVYYWRVDALLPDLGTAATGLRGFVVRDP